MKSTNKKKGIRYGNIEIPDEAFKTQNVKLKVTAYLDLDIVQELKKEALKTGSKYQTLMNQKLRDTIFGKTIDPALRDAIVNIVRQEIAKKSA
jgi:uncharacterized protein (DUF4415 family)